MGSISTDGDMEVWLVFGMEATDSGNYMEAVTERFVGAAYMSGLHAGTRAVPSTMATRAT